MGVVDNREHSRRKEGARERATGARDNLQKLSLYLPTITSADYTCQRALASPIARVTPS